MNNLQAVINEAAFDEMLFWNLQLAEHVEITRSFINPVENVTMHQIDRFTVLYHRLLDKLRRAGAAASSPLQDLAGQSGNLSVSFMELLSELTAGICKYRIKEAPDCSFIEEHLRHEAGYFESKMVLMPDLLNLEGPDFFLSIPPRSFLPRLLYKKMPDNRVPETAIDELFFWLDQCHEHARFICGAIDAHAANHQIQIEKNAAYFMDGFKTLAERLPANPDEIELISSAARSAAVLNQQWLNYLYELHRLSSICEITPSQMDLRLNWIEHVCREHQYFQSLMHIFISRLKS